ncbi:MAG: hypothetical protein A3E81_03905 [Gammaproteobacteria bacterium RIFCSPHIGHO2_12_FULL_36_30]|nr:MAG: hypothetical protein A3E81_03905 [Gammaproteobacteria bacterium RIFCSPHIGHO2_12_FULL_36_30]
MKSSFCLLIERVSENVLNNNIAQFFSNANKNTAFFDKKCIFCKKNEEKVRKMAVFIVKR